MQNLRSESHSFSWIPTRAVLVRIARAILIAVIKGYRYLISPVLGASCRFYPSCSQYALAALEQHGIGKALFLTLKRLLRCQPWARGGVDFVPK